MENPYASPSPTDGRQFLGGDVSARNGTRRRGMVGHVRVLGILMIVKGAFDLVIGLFVVGVVVLMVIMAQATPPPNGGPNHPGPPPAVMVVMVNWIFGVVMYLGPLVAGILYVYAGWKSIMFRQRKLGLVSLFVGILPVITCSFAIMGVGILVYGLFVLTAIGFLVYGLIVLLDGSVRMAFELGQQGWTAKQIDDYFNPRAQARPIAFPKE